MTFQVATGDLEPAEVTVEIRGINRKTKPNTFPCSPCNAYAKPGIWFCKCTKLPKKDLVYEYVAKKYHFLSMDHFNISENQPRHLPSSVAQINDVFQPESMVLDPVALYAGLEGLIEQFYASINSSSDMSTVFAELEHMWPAFESSTINSVTGQKLKVWIESKLKVNIAKEDHSKQLLFLCVIYGKLAKFMHWRLQDKSPQIMKAEAEVLLTTLQETGTKQLTMWCYDPLRFIAKQVLHVAGKPHWSFIHVHFPHLFEAANHIKEAKEEFPKPIDFRALCGIIPKVVDNYNKGEAIAIVCDIADSVDPKDRARVVELLKPFYPYNPPPNTGSTSQTAAIAGGNEKATEQKVSLTA